MNYNAISSFIKHIEIEKCYSHHTIEKYEYILNDLYEFSNVLNKNIEDLSLNDLKMYIIQNYDKRYAKATNALTISVIKSFYKYLTHYDIIFENPAQLLMFPKKSKKIPIILYENEVETLVENIDINKKYGKRNKAIIMMLYSCGLRVSELVNLQLKDIDENQNIINVIGKGNKEREVPINDYALYVLNEYIVFERDSLNKEKIEEILWLNNKGTKLTQRGVRYILNKEIENTSILSKISPHTLRHSFATHLLNSGMDIRLVQEILGHSNLSSTEVYTHLEIDTIKSQYEKLNLR